LNAINLFLAILTPLIRMTVDKRTILLVSLMHWITFQHVNPRNK